MTSVADLFSLAYYFASRAKGLQHAFEPETPPGSARCLKSCSRCWWEARARLYQRAGEAGKALEDRL